MAVDRQAARHRVKKITNWTAGGAVVLTAAFAYGAATGGHAGNPTATSVQQPQVQRGGDGEGEGEGQSVLGFLGSAIQSAGTAPSNSSAPPAATSGGS